MKGSVYHLLDFIFTPGVFCQINPEEDTYYPIFIISALLLITGFIIWMSYYYWSTAHTKSTRDRYRIKSARLVKNGRKFWRKNQNA
jgi:hypothetical protein